MAGSGSIGSASGSNASGASGDYIVTTFPLYIQNKAVERTKQVFGLGGSLYFLEFSFAFSCTRIPSQKAFSFGLWDLIVILKHVLGAGFMAVCGPFWKRLSGNEHISFRMGRKTGTLYLGCGL